MSRTLTYLLLLALLLPASVFAQTPQPPDLPQTPFVARITFHSRTQLAALNAALDVWEVHPRQGYLLAALQPAQAADLLRKGYQVQVEADKTALLNTPPQETPYQTHGIPGYPCYRTVEETYADLSALSAAYPNLAQWVDIGDSWEKTQAGGSPGYNIYALVLTNQAIPGPKPTFFLMAAIHARELTTAETAARFAEYLLHNYGSDPDVTWLLDFSEIHIVAQANPDGRKMAEGGEYWRKNTDNDDGCTTYPDYGTDLNRNSSFQWGGSGSSGSACSETYRGPAPASEPEVQAIQNYVSSIFPDQRGSGLSDPAPDTATGVFITLHSYSELVLWPWGFDYPQAPNHTQLQTLGRKFAYFNGYSPSQSSDLYPAAGTTDDWAYGELGIAAYTFELGTSFFQACSTFENTIYPDNLPALLYAAKASRRPYQLPAGPDTLSVSVTPTTTVPGLPLTISAQADDTRYGSLGGIEPSQNVSAARFSIDAPSWVSGTLTYTLQPADGLWDSPQEALSGQFDPFGMGLAPGRHTLFIEARDAAGHWGVPSAVFFWMPEYGLELHPLESTQYGLPGTTVTTTLRLTNSAALSDTFTLTLSGNQWPANAPATSGMLLPGETVTLPVTVSIPAQAAYGDSDLLQVSVASQGNPAAQAVASITTLAADYQPTLTAQSARHLWGAPAQVLTYTLQVRNSGNLPQQYLLAVAGNTWEVQVPPDSGAPLPPNKARSLSLSATIPANALPGDSDTFTVTVSAADNPAQQASLSLMAGVPLYRAQVEMRPPQVSGVPGAVLSASLRLTNTGNMTDTYALTWQGGNWPLAAPAGVSLSPGEAVGLPISATIPLTAAAGLTHTWQVEIQGSGAPISAHLQALSAAHYDLRASLALPANAPAYPGTTLSASLHLTNTGNLSDTYQVRFAGDWALSRTLTLTLGAGEQVTLPLTISIPDAAPEGAQGLWQVDITSQGDATQHQQLTGVTQVIWRRVYLPLLQR